MDTGLPVNYAERIRQLRSRLGLTQSQLAELLGVSFATVNRWENRKARPTALAWRQVERAEREGVTALGIARPVSSEEPASRARLPLNDISADFTADPDKVGAVGEAERLAFGHLFSPAFATEVSLIDPLPHQLIAVYDHMLGQAPLRFLNADDAGAGKTIMCGLYVREQLTRRLVRRVLIVPPAGLLGNWHREMETLFRLPFRVITGADGRVGNPFAGPDSDLLIVSVDTLAGDRMFSRLAEESVEPYDLVVFDEAHKLSADREQDLTVRRTERYRLAEALCGVGGTREDRRLNWSCPNVLLLTATPHMGKDFPYYCLWRLLEPEVLSTFEAFGSYPQDARQRHFIRRTKEEMVFFDGSPLYPQRVCDTLSYDLSQGPVSEQRLYDETTAYIETFYNRARILNRSAARFAMSIFQRRLASSTYALLRSLQRRLTKLVRLVEDMRAGRLTEEQLRRYQASLDREVHDTLDEKTADEESTEDGREENEVAEDKGLEGVVAVSLTELEAERLQVEHLVDLAQRVYAQSAESKFEKLREVLNDDRFRGEKLIVFTEHKDTLEFLVGRLEGLGFTGQIAQIHGGMDYQERERQIEFFRRPTAEGGAVCLVATDAAGEGINLQFCWLTVNYDIPWNPARLEQRMGRIHRYGQKHDPVFVLNLVAGKTREGRVLKTLLEKLERIRREMGSDKVFDVVGRLFEGVSLKEYMEKAASEEGADEAERRIEGLLTKEQVEALRERERRLYGDGGDVKTQLPALAGRVEVGELRRLLPGYVRRFIERAAPLLGMEIIGDLDGLFSLRPERDGALDRLWPVLETYPDHQRGCLTVNRPPTGSDCIFLHPGEPVFDTLRDQVCDRFAADALRGAVFVDPTATEPYLFHLASVSVMRQPDEHIPSLARDEVMECRLVGIRQPVGRDSLEECPMEQLLLLRGGSPHASFVRAVASSSRQLIDRAREYAVEHVARALADQQIARIMHDSPGRRRAIASGYDFLEADLAARRSRYSEKARSGDSRAQGELTAIRNEQQALASRKALALHAIEREPELVTPGEVRFVAHALVLTSDDPEDRRRHDEEVEALAVRLSIAHEESFEAIVRDVSTPPLAVRAGLSERPGFDLHSKRPDGEERAIEVKGRAAIGDIELTENEWAQACNLRDRYWLYVVFECASAHPRLLRVRDPFASLLVRAKGGVVIDEQAIFDNAEESS
jgi:superfamily II DNA or RNA helicase/transcriptional regulator with XRE-family HTH domain